jgi:spore germination cell wall hydrolase CwlJ-like protein
MGAPTRIEAIKPTGCSDESSPQLQPDFGSNLQAAQRNPQNVELAGASPSTNPVPVASGNTLSGIAHTNGVSMQALYEANPQFDPGRADGILNFDRSPQGGWDPDYIRPEDTIQVPKETGQIPAETAAAPPPPNGEPANGTTPPSGAAGDTPGASPRVELSAADRDNVIRTVWGEAASEPPQGQEAVAHVIRNRVLAGYGDNATEVVHAPWQFEPWNTPAGRERMQNIPTSEYERIGDIVDRVFRGEATDVTHGATHFYSPGAQAAAGREPPEWATPATQLAEIGAHEFYAPSGPAHQA